jgi:hypothetical protein
MALDAPEVADAVALLRAILADDQPAVRAILDIVDVSALVSIAVAVLVQMLESEGVTEGEVARLDRRWSKASTRRSSASSARNTR